MTDRDYTDYNRPPHLHECMRKVAEEAGEVVQIAMKTMQYGLLSHNRDPINPQTNKELLTEECGDIMAQIDVMVAHGIIDRDELKARRKLKRSKFLQE